MAREQGGDGGKIAEFSGYTNRRVAYVSRKIRKAAYMALGAPKYETLPAYWRKLLVRASTRA